MAVWFHDAAGFDGVPEGVHFADTNWDVPIVKLFVVWEGVFLQTGFDARMLFPGLVKVQVPRKFFVEQVVVEGSA